MAEHAGGTGTLGFVARELDRIADALQQSPPPEHLEELYAAQQALCWAIDPDSFASPLDAIGRKTAKGTPVS
jgi:hypothetical protein